MNLWTSTTEVRFIVCLLRITNGALAAHITLVDDQHTDQPTRTR
jgi:hypothetical protein